MRQRTGGDVASASGEVKGFGLVGGCSLAWWRRAGRLAGGLALLLFASPAWAGSEALAERAVTRAAEVRGWEVREEVTLRVVDRAALLEHMRHLVDRDVTVGELERSERLLRLLRLWTTPLTYREAMMAMLEDQVAGLYDPAERVLWVLAEGSEAEQWTVTVHEALHALQDQRVDLDVYRGREAHLTDFSLARQAVVEGEATAVMLVESAEAQGVPAAWALRMAASPLAALAVQARPPALAGLPDVLWETLLFPYLGGLAFVERIHRERQGWRGVDAFYVRAPLSTAEIMQPRRYLSAWEPTWLETSCEGTGWERWAVDVVGQAMITSLWSARLGDGLNLLDLRREAEAWAGDRLEAWSTAEGDRVRLCWVVRVEGAEAAEGWAARTLELVLGWAGVDGASVVQSSGAEGARAWFLFPGGGAVVERWGDLVFLVWQEGAVGMAPDAVEEELATALAGYRARLSVLRYPAVLREAAGWTR